MSSIYHLRLHYLPILAKAIKELFPFAELLGGGLSDHGFFYDFVLGETVFDHEFLKALEGRIQEILRDSHEMSFVEMMRDVAVNYLSHKKQRAKALFLQENYSPGIMGFLKFDDYIEPVHEDVSIIPLSQLKYFELFEVEQLPGGDVVRIEGTAFFSSKDLKGFRKKRKEFTGCDHLTLAREMRLFVYDSTFAEGVWLPKGVEWLKFFVSHWEAFCSTMSVREVKTAAFSEEEYLDKLNFIKQESEFKGDLGFGEILSFEKGVSPENARGMWRLNKIFTDRVCVFTEWGCVEEVLISSLQSIMKTVNILGSDCCWTLCTPTTGPFTQKQQGNKSLLLLQKALEACQITYKTEFVNGEETKEPRVYCLVPDGLGKHWKGPFVGVSSSESNKECQAVICCSLFGSIERMVASILERYKGELPFQFTPEQVRLVAMPSQSDYTNQVCKSLIDEGFRVGTDLTDKRLAEKIHAAEKERIPYIVVIGEVEAKKGTLSLRNGAKNGKQRKLTINDLLDELHQENSEKSPFAR